MPGAPGGADPAARLSGVRMLAWQRRLRLLQCMPDARGALQKLTYGLVVCLLYKEQCTARIVCARAQLRPSALIRVVLLQELSLTFIGSSAVPAAALGRLCQYQGLTQLALEGCPRWVAFVTPNNVH